MAPADDQVKVRGEVVAVLFDGHVKELRKTGQWCAAARAVAWRPASDGFPPRDQLQSTVAQSDL